MTGPRLTVRWAMLVIAVLGVVLGMVVGPVYRVDRYYRTVRSGRAELEAIRPSDPRAVDPVLWREVQNGSRPRTETSSLANRKQPTRPWYGFGPTWGRGLPSRRWTLRPYCGSGTEWDSRGPMGSSTRYGSGI